MSDTTNATTVDTSVVETPSESSDNVELDLGIEKSGGESKENDPNESFSDWIKRQDGKPKETKDDKKESKEVKDTKEEKADAPKTSKVKVGDKEYEPAELEKLVADSETSTAKAKEYETQIESIKKNITDFFTELKTNPEEIFNNLDMPRDVIEKYYYKKYIEEDTLTTEQKLERYKKADADRKAKEDETKAEAKRREEQEQMEAHKEHYRKQWETNISKAIEDSGLPNTDWVVARYAGYLRQAIDKKLTHIQPNDVSELVKKDLADLQQSNLKSMSPEQIAAALGDDVMKKIRESETSKYKNSKFESKKSTTGTVKRDKKDSKRITNIYDLLDDE